MILSPGIVIYLALILILFNHKLTISRRRGLSYFYCQAWCKARTTFGEMIIRHGWLPNNTSSYNAFLSPLVNGFQVEEALKFLAVMKTRKWLPVLGFFRNTLQILYQRKDTKNAYGLWELMKQSGILLDLPTYNTMIGVFCSANPIQVDFSYRLLDEMVFTGIFPDF
jgi:pentatricopeptide repeat protein